LHSDVTTERAFQRKKAASLPVYLLGIFGGHTCRSADGRHHPPRSWVGFSKRRRRDRDRTHDPSDVNAHEAYCTGSIYSVTYYKPENSPQLLAKRIADHDDLRFPMTAAEFLAEAWRLANVKARELGWKV
jgi:hypothetical protein